MSEPKQKLPPVIRPIRVAQLFCFCDLALSAVSAARHAANEDALVTAIAISLLGLGIAAPIDSIFLGFYNRIARKLLTGIAGAHLILLIASLLLAGGLSIVATVVQIIIDALILYIVNSVDVRVAYSVAEIGHQVDVKVTPQLPPAPGKEQREIIYSIRGLTKHFPIHGGLLGQTIGAVQAVDDISFDIYRGETIGLVGESGCGKTTTGRLLLRLLEATAGELIFEGRDIRRLTYAEMKPLRAKMQIVFQDPYASLNPRLPVGDIIGEGLYNFGVKSAAEREKRVSEMLEIVGLRKYYINRYPHEFSGGQRQRIGIARALVLRPTFVIADEPVSALDVSIQAQVLNLFKDLQKELNLTYVFISHNLSVVEHVSDRVGVMYLGKLVELADSMTLYEHPKHPYTQALLSAVPIPDPAKRRDRILLQGDVPSPINPPSACRFHTRCPLRAAGLAAQPGSDAARLDWSLCTTHEPAFEPNSGDARHLVACHFSDTSVEREFEAKAAL